MKKARKYLKRAGLMLLGVLLILVLIVGALVIWLRIEPETVTSCEVGFRLIEDSQGSVCIPDTVERAVPIGSGAIQLFLAVEQEPAAHIEIFDQYLMAEFPTLDAPWQTLTRDAVKLGLPPSLETLLAVDADVIISELDLGSVNKAVEQLAPYVLMSLTDSWKENMLLTSDVIDERKTAEALLADYESRVQTLRAHFDDPSKITVAILVLGDERKTLHLPATFGGQMITDAGFSYPDALLELIEDNPDPAVAAGFYPISDEVVNVIDGDFIVVYGISTEGFLEDDSGLSDALVDAIAGDPLFESLSAVQEGNVIVGGVYWGEAGIYSAHAVLDDMFRHIADVDPEEVAPNPLLSE
ncbi:MAG: ABC transporter substrate-binding protein [Chloroflexota bacterium]